MDINLGVNIVACILLQGLYVHWDLQQQQVDVDAQKKITVASLLDE